MVITKPKYRVVCECGACRNIAMYTVVFDRVGISRGLHICAGCAKDMHAELGTQLPSNLGASNSVVVDTNASIDKLGTDTDKETVANTNNAIDNATDRYKNTETDKEIGTDANKDTTKDEYTANDIYKPKDNDINANNNNDANKNKAMAMNIAVANNSGSHTGRYVHNKRRTHRGYNNHRREDANKR